MDAFKQQGAVRAQEPSHLLRACKQLPDMWWGKHLLPLLMEAGAADACALSCKQLRAICQRSVTWLRLSAAGLEDELEQLEAVDGVDALSCIPHRFPFCKQLSITLANREDAAFFLADTLSALEQLTSLSTLALDVCVLPTTDVCMLAPAISTVGRWLQVLQRKRAALQDPGNRSTGAGCAAAGGETAEAKVHFMCDYTLSLKLQAPQLPWKGHPQLWKALGQLTQLQRLSLEVVKGETCLVLPASISFGVQQLSALAPLAPSLQSLVVVSEAAAVDAAPGADDYAFLCSFARLTELQLHLGSSSRSMQRAAQAQELGRGLAALGACTRLQRLCLLPGGAAALPGQGGTDYGHMMSAAECAALGQLQQLTELQLHACDRAAGFKAPSFLSGLQQLRVLRLNCLSSRALGVLATLTQLTQLEGLWHEEAAPLWPPAARAPVIVQSTSVRRVAGRGPIAMPAFPGVTSLRWWGKWEPNDACRIARECPQLRELDLGSGISSKYTELAGLVEVEPPTEIEAERVRAVSAVSALQHLTKLSFHAESDAALAAVAGLTQLQQLWLSLHASCSLHFLMQLSAARNLRLLQLQVPLDCFAEYGERRQSFCALLASLRHVARFEVCLVVCEDLMEAGYFNSLLDEAKEWLDDCGLAGPAEMSVVSRQGYEPPSG